MITPVRAPRAKYTIVGEAIRYVIPGHMQCSIGCGGQACKYDNPSYWSDDQQAIKGLYSSWYTCTFRLSTVFQIFYFNQMFSYFLLSHEGCGLLRNIHPTNFFFYSSRVTDHLLAMSRPSTEIIEKYNIIDQFRRYTQLCLSAAS